VRSGGAAIDGSGVSEEQQIIEDQSPRVRIEVVDHLPQGRLVARFEVEHDTIFAVVVPRPDQMFEFFRQFEGVMQEGVDSMWSRARLQIPQLLSQ
jgi:nitrogenase subunit NifH